MFLFQANSWDLISDISFHTTIFVKSIEMKTFIDQDDY